MQLQDYSLLATQSPPCHICDDLPVAHLHRSQEHNQECKQKCKQECKCECKHKYNQTKQKHAQNPNMQTEQRKHECQQGCIPTWDQYYII